MHLRQDPFPAQAERAEPLVAPLAAASSMSDTPAMSHPLSTGVLLAGRNAVTIEHQGVHYVLRATRSGKLILTK